MYKVGLLLVGARLMAQLGFDGGLKDDCRHWVKCLQNVAI